MADDGPAVVVLSNTVTPAFVAAAIALGASGYLAKTAETSVIEATVRTAASGDLAFTREQLRRSERGSWVPLTDREHRIIAGIMKGPPNDELTIDLGLAKKTIERHITRLLARFGLATRTELALKAERESLLDLPTDPHR